MPIYILFCVMAALLCFLLGTFQVITPGRPINWISAGLAFLTLAYLVR